MFVSNNILYFFQVKNIFKYDHIRKSPRQNELTPIIFLMELTHLGLEASNYII